MKCVAEAPETNKTTARSISEPVEEWIFHKTLKSDRPPHPKAITITIATTQM